MSEEVLGHRGRLALAAALGTGVVLGAAGIVVYQVGRVEAVVVETIALKVLLILMVL